MKPPRKPDFAPELHFPTRPKNAPSLPRIGYRIGTYSDIRTSLLRHLDQEPNLAGWSHREPDDPGIALLEGAAIVGDILTFYQQLYANEAFLRTAGWRESVADLVRLTGYRLSPGLGGSATFGLLTRGTRPVVVPAGFQIKADLDGLDDTATFETDETITAYPWLAEFNLFAPLDDVACQSGTKALRTSDSVTLTSGDRVLLASTNPFNPVNEVLAAPEIAIVDEVKVYHGETRFTIKGTLKRSGFVGGGPVSQLKAFKLGRSFRHFGYNAPAQDVTVKDDGSGVLPKNTQYWRPDSYPTDSNNPPTTVVDPALDPKTIPLDQSIDDLTRGGLMILDAEYRAYGTLFGPTGLRRMQEVFSGTMRWGGLQGAATFVVLDQNINFNDIKGVQLYEVLGEQFTVKAQRPSRSGIGKELWFYGQPGEAANLLHRDLLLAKPGAPPIPLRVNDVTLAGPAARLTLDTDVSYADFSENAPTVTVHGNLVSASQGKSEKRTVVGSGNAAAVFQTFLVPRSPLTYLPVVAAEGPQIHVWVAGREWRCVPSLYGKAADAEIFVVRQDRQGDSWIQFGDGKTGARLPSGVDNVQMLWRTGIGAFGPMKPDTDPSLGSRVEGIKGAKLPGVVAGGADPEDGAHARDAAPGRLQSLDRLVSLADFEAEALQISGVAKASASWELYAGVPTVRVRLLMAPGRTSELEAARQRLSHLNDCRGPQRHPLKVTAAELEYVFVDATVSIDRRRIEEDVLVAVERALGVSGREANGVDGTGGLFDLGERRIGQPEYASRIEGVIQNVDGVVWCQVTALGSLGTAADPKTLVVPAAPRPLALTLPCAADRLLRLYHRADEPPKGALTLSVAPSPSGQCADG